MSVDLGSLGTFTRLADAGATQASASLSALTGIDAGVDVTRVRLCDRSEVEESFEAPYVGVRIGFGGGLSGQTLLWFDPESADRVVRTLLPDPDEEGSRAGLLEVGNITISGFIDGWADHLGTSIDIEPPTYVSSDPGAADDAPSLVEDHLAADEEVFVFESELRTVGEELGFRIFMFPDHGEGDSPLDGIPVDRLARFGGLVEQGAESASQDMTAMTGVDTTVEVSTLSFVPVETVPRHLDETVRVGTVLEFMGPPDGYIAILFDEPSAMGVASSLMPGMEPEPGFEGMTQSAIQEIGNVLTSGFIDGWANALETTIDITPPQFVHDIGPAILDPLAASLAATQEHAFLLESAIETDEEAFSCAIYALPDERHLERALETLPTAAD